MNVEEGQNITLEWTYNLNNVPFFFAQFNPQGGSFIVRKAVGQTRIDDGYTARISANITDTFSSITLLAVNRSDTGTYEFEIENFNGGPPKSIMEIQVQCK